MRKLFLLAGVFSLYSLPAQAGLSDSAIFVQQPSGVTTTLWSVMFADTLHGWACGDNGNLVRTSDGGQQWQKVAAFSTRSLDAVYFVNPATGWLVTDTAQIYKSTDSGATWSQQFFLGRAYFSDCVFLNDQTGFASGGWMNGANMYNDGIIYKTVNGGTNWTLSASYLITVSGIGSLTFPDNQHGWATGMDYLLKTTNTGQTWATPVEFRTIADSEFLHGPDSVYAYINDVFFRDSLNGFGYGRYGYVIRTRNGGQSWTSVTRVTPWLEGMAFADNSRGVIAGERGAVLVSGDTGATWRLLYPRQQPTLNAPWWRSVFFANAGNGWICGDSGLILKAVFYNPPAAIATEKSFVKSNGALKIMDHTGAIFTVSFNLSESGPIRLDLCNLQGRTIRTLAAGYRNAGSYSETFVPGENMKSGIYCISLKAKNNSTCASAVIFR